MFPPYQTGGFLSISCLLGTWDIEGTSSHTLPVHYNIYSLRIRREVFSASHVYWEHEILKERPLIRYQYIIIFPLYQTGGFLSISCLLGTWDIEGTSSHTLPVHYNIPSVSTGGFLSISCILVTWDIEGTSSHTLPVHYNIPSVSTGGFLSISCLVECVCDCTITSIRFFFQVLCSSHSYFWKNLNARISRWDMRYVSLTMLRNIGEILYCSIRMPLIRYWYTLFR